MVRHKKAVPLHKNLKNKYKDMTPEQVQLSYQHGLISEEDNRLFECLFNECHAPITCQGMTKKSSSAFFIEGKRSDNLHINDCPFSEESLKKDSNNTEKEQEVTYEPSGLTIMDMKGGQFSRGLKLPSNENETTTITEHDGNPSEESEKGPIKTVSPKQSENLPTKPRNKHFKDIESFVSHYEENPDYIIDEGFLGQNLPIHRYFHSIKENHVPKRERDRIPIYYGNGYVRFSEKGYYSFFFSDGVSIDSNWYQPHFFVSKEFIDYFFPFVKNYCEKNGGTINIYIQSRFWLGKTKNDKSVLRFQNRGEKLTPFIYFTERM